MAKTKKYSKAMILMDKRWTHRDLRVLRALLADDGEYTVAEAKAVITGYRNKEVK